MNQYSKAIPYFNKAIAMGAGNKNGKTEFLLGICYIGLDDRKNGCKFLVRSNELGYPDARQYMNAYCK